MAESYYAARSRRDPGWRLPAIAGAGERKRRRPEQDPEAFAERHREAQRRCYEGQAATGLTFAELLRRIGGERETPAFVLRDEARLGRVDYLGFSRRYRLNGGLDEATSAALRELEL